MLFKFVCIHFFRINLAICNNTEENLACVCFSSSGKHIKTNESIFIKKDLFKKYNKIKSIK